MIEKEVKEMLSFIDGNPTAYHTTASVRNILLKEGFSELLERRRWQLEPGRSYFVCRNGSDVYKRQSLAYSMSGTEQVMP